MCAPGPMHWEGWPPGPSRPYGRRPFAAGVSGPVLTSDQMPSTRVVVVAGMAQYLRDKAEAEGRGYGALNVLMDDALV